VLFRSLSPRREALLVKVNCPALAPSLFESELFGHTKGAFTGAQARRVGRFEMADGGTVFLDEVGDLPPELQAKLLHVLQDQTFERVGESKPIRTDFRVISATNHDLEAAMAEGRFRSDLYYRLDTIRLRLPPLRERAADVPLLVERLTEVEAGRSHCRPPRYEPGAVELLQAYSWPGNVRELKNLVKRMVILRPGEAIAAADLDKFLSTGRPGQERGLPSLAEVERRHIESALARCGGAVGGPGGAARALGLPRTTLQYRMRKYGLKAAPARNNSRPRKNI
jgi:transcriptional regulator with GAF, ATPase, and Fis domain